MAHQFSSSPGFGAGYPIPPFYPPFVQNPPQQLSNLQPGYQQSNPPHSSTHTPTPRSNNTRFDANAHVNSQPSPLPFPPPLNPEMFKHFPPPLPPPPAGFSAGPGTPTGFQQFSQSIGNAAQPYGQHNFPSFSQPHAPVNSSFIQTQNSGASIPPLSGHLAPGYTHVENKVIHDFRYGTSTDARVQVAPLINHERLNSPIMSHSFDGSSHSVPGAQFTMTRSSMHHQPIEVLDSSSKETSSIIPPQAAENPAQQNVQASSPTFRMKSVDTKTQSKLKENAKAAILSLLPHKIVYNDLLTEGVDAQVLQSLYSELGLSWKNTDDGTGKVTTNNKPDNKDITQDGDPKVAVIQSDNFLQPPTHNALPTSNAKSTPAGPSAVRSASIVNPGLERKDRIAQLLAAKTGKIGILVGASQSGSPASVTESIVAQPPLSRKSASAEASPMTSIPESVKPFKPIPQTELVRQKMEQLRKETAEKLRAAEAAQVSAVRNTINAQPPEGNLKDVTGSQFASISTPVRESLVKEGLSSMIPGLFMTSADEEVQDGDIVMQNSKEAHDFDPLTSGQGQTKNQSYSPGETCSSLKRAATTDLADEEHGSVKRIASSRAESVDIEMDIDRAGDDDDMSEGEVIDDEETPHHAVPRVSDLVSSEALRETNQTSIELPETAMVSQQDMSMISSPQPAKHPKQFEIDTLSDIDQRKPDLTTHNTIDSSVSINQIATSVTQLPLKATTSSSSVAQGSEAASSGGRALVSPRPLAKLTPTQFAERAAQLKADFIRQRSLRQKQLIEGMPALNDEVVKTQQRLEQYKAKLADVRHVIEKHEADIRTERESESEVLREIAHLEKQLQDGVSGQKEFSKELREIKRQQEDDSTSLKGSDEHRSVQARSIPTTTETTVRQSQEPNESKQPDRAIVKFPQNQATQPAAAVDSNLPDSEESPLQPKAAVHDDHSIEQQPSKEQLSDYNAARDGIDGYESAIDGRPATDSLHTEDDMRDDQDLQEDDSEDDEPMDQSEDESDGTHMSVDHGSDGSASMSDSGSDDYEPPEPKPQPSSAPQIADSEIYEPLNNMQTVNHTKSHEIADDYEPSDVVEAANTSNQNSPDMFLTSTSTPTTNHLHSHQNGISSIVSEVARESTTDHQEKGLQLSEANTLTKPQDVADSVDSGARILSGGETSSYARFIPYQSPLSSFKSYRFHPSFAEQIKNGYRSLTYSNKIDPKRPICPTELTGEACTDPECEEQHFGSMALTDDKILVQMSSANDIKDKALRDQYLLGLKQVIARLRQEGVKEFPLVADALSKYRREWTASQTGL